MLYRFYQINIIKVVAILNTLISKKCKLFQVKTNGIIFKNNLKIKNVFHKKCISICFSSFCIL